MKKIKVTVDKFGVPIEVGDEIIFATSGEMDEGIVHTLTRGGRILRVKNSSGYLKEKQCKHVINKTELMKLNPELML